MVFIFPDNNAPELCEPLVEVMSGLSDQEIAQIIEYGDHLEKTTVKLYGRFGDSRVKAHGSHFR
jgi:hypothetical protein